MAKRWLWAGLLPVLAVAAVLSSPTESRAWGWGGGYAGWGGFRGGYGGYGGWSGFYSPYYTGYGLGWGGYPMYAGYGYTAPNYMGYWGDASYVSPTYYTTYGTPQVGIYQSSYPATNQTSANRNDARVRVEVPANAEVWFGGFKTAQIGTDRLFVSPPLNPKSNYNYEVRARWMENGRTVDRVRSVPVHAGETATVNFMNKPANQSVNAPAAPADSLWTSPNVRK